MSPPHAPSTAIAWPNPERQALFQGWLDAAAARFELLPHTLRPASADASFRRYFRIDGKQGTRIVMDAPPEHENSEPFVRIAALMRAAGLRVPQVLDWDRAGGFLLLDDLGQRTLLDVVDREHPARNLPHFRMAIDALVRWQRASRPGELPPYDEAVLRRELSLFPDWYLARHRGVAVQGALAERIEAMTRLIVARNLAAPTVHVHRDFMPRNLMVADEPGTGALGVLDFQDALHGPITYDIASLMRDAFLSWDEEFVLDVSVRYWQAARAAGLITNGPWGEWESDFGSFFAAVEWMGLQRHLKVLGIFARLTLRDGKPKYLADTPRFIGYVRHTALRYRELAPLLQLIDEVEGTAAAPATFTFGRIA